MYFVFKDLHPIARLVCSFSYNDKDMTLYVNKRQLNIPEENYTNAKIAFAYALAYSVDLLHEKVLCDPSVARDHFNITGESIQAFLEHKKSAG